MTWLLDTLTYTGALILLVLMLRKLIARHFGPGMAYALWALPLLRLVLPPLVLPAPAMSGPISAVPEVSDMIIRAAPVAAAAPAWTLSEALQAVWLGGAVLFLLWRVSGYVTMRRRLLAGARPVGEYGAIRLVESPQAASPVAFGVFDKVVALPMGFMDRADRMGRDLALAHELEHHAGRDLAVNLAMQPLLALHWFNPLAWAGWRALRHDQEAACDARVLAGSSPQTRLAYGELIAAFATAPRLSLSAPLACPILGEKNIIHRLRSMTMNEPTPRRRLIGRVLIGTGLLALPLTASISYAAGEDQPAAAPAAPATGAKTETRVSNRMVIIEHAGREGSVDESKLQTRVINRDGKTIILKTDKQLSDAEVEAKIAEIEKNLPVPPVPPVPPVAGVVAPDAPRIVSRVVMMSADGKHRIDPSRLHALTMLQTDCSTPAAAANGDNQAVQVVICGDVGHRANAMAAEGLRKARDRIKADTRLSDDVRREVLEELDSQITELSKEG